MSCYTDPNHWYHHRHELSQGQVFRLADGSFVKLDRRVAGDGTKWFVADWHNGWAYCDNEIEPGDLRGDPLDELTQIVAVKDLKPGDALDLEGDPIADPGHSNALLENEYQVVDEIEVETPACTVVHCQDFTCGFSPNHLVKVARRAAQ